MANSHIEVVFHHGGKFENNGTFGYHYGETTTIKIDPDRWSYFEILSILKEMGYRNVKDLWYSLGRGPVLEDCLEPLLDDKGACHLINIAMLNGEAHLYVIHRVCEPEYLLQLECISEPQIDRPSDEGEVERDSADLQVDRPSVEGEVERESAEKEVQIEIGVADVEAVGEAEVQTIAPEVEPESEVHPEMIEVEVDVLADIEGMVEDVGVE
ncbi:hypothetical protein VIGAN_07240200, partial [Vigna angularis var. angularis]